MAEPFERLWCSSNTMTGWHAPRSGLRRAALVAAVATLVAIAILAFASSASSHGIALGRPLHLPRVAKGAPCPVSSGAVANNLGRGLARMPAAGAGPVYLMSVGDDPAGSLGVPGADPQGWRGQKAPWIASPRYRGPILIRGARIDGRGELRFARSTGEHLLALYQRRGQSIQPNGWRVWPSLILVHAPGCYALQIDGISFSHVIVIHVHALAPWPYY
jgi:hypothetical protein